MKRIGIIIVLLFAFLAFKGCQEDVVSDYYNQYEGYILEGYRQDLLPLYKMVAIDRCNLQVRDNNGVFMNVYALTYYTKASKNELKKFYKDILGENEFNTSDYLMGENEGHQLSVSIQPREDDIRVVLTLELPKILTKESNMFFENFPRNLIDQYVKEDEKMIEESFTCSSNKDGQHEFFFVYEATANEEQLVKELSEHYEGNTDYKADKTTDGKPFISWTAGEYKVTFVYEKEYNQMNVSISEPMKKNKKLEGE